MIEDLPKIEYVQRVGWYWHKNSSEKVGPFATPDDAFKDWKRFITGSIRR